MRILCSLCAPPDNVLGEKCPRCGNDNLGSLHSILTGQTDFICSPCRFVFHAGEGGASHTLCPMHAAQARAAAGLPPKEVS